MSRPEQGESVESLLGRVADEFTERQQSGEKPDVEEYAQRYPQIADVIRQIFPALQTMQNLSVSPATAMDTVGPDGSVSGILGDFRILKEVGRGGMGVVYEAEQISLGRRVALKVLPFAAVLDPRQLQRFRNEAQAAAQLHHTNIVPVYTVGSERGVYFFAMQYIEGRTLAGVIEELRTLAGLDRGETPDIRPPVSEIATTLIGGPDDSNDSRQAGLPIHRPAATDASSELGATLSGSGSIRSRTFFRNIAGLGVQAARALEHAHRVGVIHRDIKPSNLLLDAQGNVWVTDFGLASIRSADQTLTMPGDVVGTLRYMSPEQAQGESALADRRADVYSLGATLYELVTLHPAFAGRNRHDVLRQIVERPPHSPRRFNNAVPVDLETILLKAMAKEPGGRYGSAAALAEDLQRFQEDRPILARPPSALERLAKWSRRHTALVGTALAALLLIAVGLAISTVLIAREQKRTSNALGMAQTNYDLAEQQRKHREANLTRALAAMDRMTTEVGQQELARVPTAVRAELLGNALQLYKGFLQDESSDPAVRLETARTHRRLGDVQRLLGEPAKAEEAYRRAIQSLTDLVRSQPQAESRYELAVSQRWLGILLRDRRQGEAAQRAFEQATTVLASLLADVEDNSRYWNQMALTYLDANNLDKAQKALQSALTWQLPARDSAWGPEEQETLAGTHHSLGHLLQKAGRTQEATAAFAKALGIYEALAARWPDTLRYQAYIGQLQFHVGDTQQQAGQLEKAEVSLRQSLRTLQEAAEASPDIVSPDSPRQMLCQVHPVLADVLARSKRVEEALSVLQEGMALQDRLLKAQPTDVGAPSPSSAADQSVPADAYAGTSPTTADPAIALRQIVAVLRRMVEQAPGVPEYREQLAKILLAIASAEARTGQYESMLNRYGEAAALYEELAAEYPAAGRYREHLAICQHRVGAHLHADNRSAEGEKYILRALTLWKGLLQERSMRERYLSQQLYDLQLLASIVERQGRLAEAEGIFRQGLDLYEQMVAEFPQRLYSDLCSECRVGTWFGLAGILARTDRCDEALTLCAKAAAFAGERAAASERAQVFLPLQSAAYRLMSEIFVQQKRPSQAQDSLASAAGVLENLMAQPESDGNYLPELAGLYMHLAMLSWQAGLTEMAQASTAKALDATDRMASDSYGNIIPVMVQVREYEPLADELCKQQRFSDAETLCRRMIRVLVKAVQEEQRATGPRFAIEAQSMLCVVLERAGRTEDALNARLQLVSDLKGWTPGEGSSLRKWSAWGTGCIAAGGQLENASRYGDAERLYRYACEAMSRLPEWFPDDPEALQLPWDCQRHRLPLLIRQNRWDEAAAVCERVLPAVERLTAGSTPPQWALWFRVNLQVDFARVLSHAGRSERAEGLYGRAIDTARQLVARDKTNAGVRDQLASHCITFGDYWANTGNPGQAVRLYEQAAQAWQEDGEALAGGSPNRMEAAKGLQRVGDAAAGIGRMDKALQYYQLALRQMESLERETSPAPKQAERVAAIRAAAATTARLLGGQLEQAGQIALAEGFYQHGIALARPVAEMRPNDPEQQRGLWGCRRRMAQLLVRQRRLDEASAQCDQVLPAVSNAIAAADGVLWLKMYRVNFHMIQADILSLRDQPEQAEALYLASVAAAEKLLDKDLGNRDGWQQLAEHRTSHADHYLRVNAPDKAIAELEQAAGILQRVAARSGGDSARRSALAAAVRRVGDLLRLAGRNDQAEAQYARAAAIEPAPVPPGQTSPNSRPSTL